MNVRQLLVMSTLSCVVSWTGATAEAAVPAKEECRKRDRPFVLDVAVEQRRGDRTTGPACIDLANVNVLRYDVRLGETVSFTPGPDLKLSFVPALEKPKPAVQEEAASDPAARGPQAEFRRALDQLGAASARWHATVRTIAELVDETNKASTSVQNLVETSDSVLTLDGGAKTLAEGSAQVAAGVGEALKEQWPLDAFLAAKSAVLAAEETLRLLPTEVGSEEWTKWLATHKLEYELAMAQATALATEVATFDAGGARRQAYDQARSSLVRWEYLLKGVKEDSFHLRHRAVCRGAFALNRQSSVKLFKADRLASPKTIQEEEIVTVTCDSPFSVSGGVGVSKVGELEWGIISSTDTTTDAATGAVSTKAVTRFARTAEAEHNVVPLLMVNARLYEFSDVAALHFSAGAVVDLESGDVGTDIEPIIGASLSLWRTMFVTAGWHFGRTHELVGFKEGDIVPEGVGAPPLEEGRKDAFFVSVSIKLR